MSTFDFLLEGLRVQGHPARFYLFGHEGLGFVGQLASAKDVEYANAHAIVGLGGRADASDLVSVLEPDVARVKSRGLEPACLLVTEPGVFASLDGAQHVIAMWRQAPLDPLGAAVKAVLGSIG